MATKKTARKSAPPRRTNRNQPATKRRQWLIATVCCALIVALYYFLYVRPAEQRQREIPGRAIASKAELQIALARKGFSPGSIDGKPGTQTRQAILAYQTRHKLEPTGELDPATATKLKVEDPVFAHVELTAADFAKVGPKPQTWRERGQVDRMRYNSILEMVAEHSQSDPDYIAQLNPKLAWSRLQPGTQILVPLIRPVVINGQPTQIQISLAGRTLQLVDEQGRILFHCPVSIARKAEKRPKGQLSVKVLVQNPNYTFNPAILSATAAREGITQKFIIQPGPNNPVGSVWIGLSLPSYGIHGTPGPENVGRTESSGCFRLANWNAQALLKAIAVGMPVQVTP